MQHPLILNQRPSSLVTLFQAFRRGKHRLKSAGTPPLLKAVWDNISLNPANVRAFENICGLQESENLPFLFPFSLLYPMNLRLLSQKNVNIPIFKMLTVRTSTLAYRPIKIDETLTATSEITGQVVYRKGTEFYIQSQLISDHQNVWENTATFFIPGRSKNEITDYTPPKLDSLENGRILPKWFLNSENRFRFAMLMGDSNGIHYSRIYAKGFGFKRDFSQPIRPASKALENLPVLPGKGPLRLDLHFKGPAYYQQMLTQKVESTVSSHRFDLYCGEEKRPCISGKLQRLDSDISSNGK